MDPATPKSMLIDRWNWILRSTIPGPVYNFILRMHSPHRTGYFICMSSSRDNLGYFPVTGGESPGSVTKVSGQFWFRTYQDLSPDSDSQLWFPPPWVN